MKPSDVQAAIGGTDYRHGNVGEIMVYTDSVIIKYVTFRGHINELRVISINRAWLTASGIQECEDLLISCYPQLKVIKFGKTKLGKEIL